MGQGYGTVLQFGQRPDFVYEPYAQCFWAGDLFAPQNHIQRLVAAHAFAQASAATPGRDTLPERGIDLVVRAVNRASFMDTTIPYWEGPVRISGSHTGRGFLEMTGY